MNAENAEWFRMCAECEEPLRLGEKHPVYMERRRGDFQLYAFCDETCKSDWLGEENE